MKLSRAREREREIERETEIFQSFVLIGEDSPPTVPQSHGMVYFCQLLLLFAYSMIIFSPKKTKNFYR